MHTLVHAPFLCLLVLASMLLVVALILTDWADKRREHKLQDLAAQMRQQHQPLPPPASASARIRIPGRRLLLPGSISLAILCGLFFALQLHPAARERTPVHVANQPARAGAISDPAVDSIAHIWFTNDPAIASLDSAGNSHHLVLDPDHVSLWGQPATEDVSAPISVSPAQGSLSDPRPPSALARRVISDIRPSEEFLVNEPVRLLGPRR